MKTVVCFSFLISLSIFSFAQDTLNTKFHFTDGVYLSLNSFISNSPDYTPKEVVLKETEHSEYSFKEIYVQFIADDSVAQNLKPQQIWGVCIKGIPFINSHHLGEEPQKGKQKGKKEEEENREKREHYCIYSRLWMIGDICFFSIKGIAAPKFGVAPMPGGGVTAYQRPNLEDTFSQKCLKTETGEIKDFNKEALALFIADDAALFSKLQKQKKVTNEELLEYLTQYNRKHPYLKK